MSTNKKYLHNEVDKKYTGANLKTTELLDCALIGVCAVIRTNTVNKILKLLISVGISCKQENHLIWICTICHKVCEFN